MRAKVPVVQINAVALAITAILLFSAKAVFVKLAYSAGGEAIPVLMLRMLFALPFFIVAAAVDFWRNGFAALRQKDVLQIIFLGMIGYYLASLFDFLGLQYIDASLERLILFVYPTLVALLSFVFLKRSITRRHIVAIVITYIGVLVAFISKINIEGSSESLLGGILIFSSALTFAIYLVGSGEVIKRVGPKRFTNLAMIVSCICIIVHNGFAYSGNILPEYAVEVYYYCALMALLSTIVPAYFMSAAIKKLGAPTVSVYGSLGPVSTIVLAIIFLGEQLSVYQIIGTLIVISGVVYLGKK